MEKLQSRARREAERRLRMAADKRRRASAQVEEANREIVEAFELAIASGIRGEDAAALAGLTKSRIYQLRRETRR